MGDQTARSDRSRAPRVRRGVMPEERVPGAGRPSALEKALRGFSERKTETLLIPKVGTSFDSLDEAFEFYNIYSWEYGFGVRYGTSRQNAQGIKTLQEIVCSCEGKPQKKDSLSLRCECPALIRLLRIDDDGWYISKHTMDHNHYPTTAYHEHSFWPSHKHIEKYNRDTVRHIRHGNVSLGEVDRIIRDRASFTGPLYDEIDRMHLEDDPEKKLDLFAQLVKKDPDFVLSEQPDHQDGRIKRLCAAGLKLAELGSGSSHSFQLVWDTLDALEKEIDGILAHKEGGLGFASLHAPPGKRQRGSQSKNALEKAASGKSSP